MALFFVKLKEDNFSVITSIAAPVEFYLFAGSDYYNFEFYLELEDGGKLQNYYFGSYEIVGDSAAVLSFKSI